MAGSKKSAGGKLKVIKSKTVFEGKVFRVTSDEVVEPSGIKGRRDVIRHSGSVVVLAVDEREGEPEVLLARQYRYAAGEELWELPAGRIDEGERPLAAAKRELIEETGIRAKSWTKALSYFSSPGFLDERMEMFLARELKRGEATPEEDEQIEMEFFPLEEAVAMCLDGRVRDGKTLAGIFWFREVSRGD